MPASDRPIPDELMGMRGQPSHVTLSRIPPRAGVQGQDVPQDAGDVRVLSGQAPASDGVRAIAPDDDFGERDLLRRLKAKDAGAYEHVMRDIGPRLLATAQRMLGNEEDARDAVQDAFLSAFRNIAGFDGKSRLSTWLHRITMNAALMKLRTKRRKPALSIEGLLPRFQDDGRMELPIASWRERGSAEAGVDEETRRFVRTQIEHLPEEYRAVIMLRDIEDLDTAETAVVLGISQSAVKTRLHRARQALRARLDVFYASGRTDGADAAGDPDLEGGEH